jgi:hypothetical protein
MGHFASSKYWFPRRFDELFKLFSLRRSAMPLRFHELGKEKHD